MKIIRKQRWMEVGFLLMEQSGKYNEEQYKYEEIILDFWHR